jgi:hypothetical protein
MTQEDIIRMARSVMEERGGSRMDDEEDLIVYSLQLAALVEEAATEAANARANASWSVMCKKMMDFERESCAKVCDRMAARCDDIRVAALEAAAENIRARGNT